MNDKNPSPTHQSHRSASSRFIHWSIVFILGSGFLSAIYMVFVVYAPPNQGGIGPLFGSALNLPHDFLVERRLYALEAWVCFGFLSIYAAIKSQNNPHP